MDFELEAGEERSGLTRFVSALRERWWLWLLTVVVVGALSLGVSLLLSPRYSATAQLAYSQADAQLASQALSSAAATNTSHNISNDALILKTTAFAALVEQAMARSVGAAELRSSVKVSSDRAQDLIEITASGSDRFLTANIANAYAGEFVKERRENSQKALTQAQKLLESRVRSMTQTEAASAYGVALKQRNDDLAVLMSLEINDYKIIQEAVAATSAYFPRPFLNLLLGLAAGLILGFLLALLLDHLDRRIKDQATLERTMKLPIIGAVPQSGSRRSRSQTGHPAVGFTEDKAGSLESMRMLRSSLKVLGFGESKRSVLITSVAPGEGKSTLAADLAIYMAVAGDRVVLVDADFHSSMIHEHLGIANEEGLSEILLDRDVPWSAKIKAVDLGYFISPELIAARKPAGKEALITKFLCLTTGPTLADPSEVLEAGVMMEVISDLQGISDYVIIDGPPLLVASYSLILAQSVDAVVLAGKLGRNTSDEIVEARELLARAEIAPLGIVICGARRSLRDSHSYYRPLHQGTSRHVKA